MMTLKLPLRNKCNIMLMNTYVPTMTNPGKAKDKFYEEPDSLISAVSRQNKLTYLEISMHEWEEIM